MNSRIAIESNAALNVVCRVMRGARSGADLDALLQEWSDHGHDDTEPCLLGLAQAAVKGWIISTQNGAIQVTSAGTAAARRS